MGVYKYAMIAFILAIIDYIIVHLVISPPSEIGSRMLRGFEIDHPLFVPNVEISIGAVFYFLRKLF